jgi:hypothetical protein
MGIPQHYSRELPERCLTLIEELWPVVETVRVPSQQHLGPLTTTFLLAMATPIITLPVERVERHFGKATEAYIDDRLLDELMTDEVRRVFKLGRFADAPFFGGGHWRFTSVPYNGENLAQHLPEHIAERLACDDALKAASRLQVAEWASALRNALAHGGVIYVDAHGRQTHGQPAKGFVFVSAKYPGGDTRQPPERLKLLRISESSFRTFLRHWVEWLHISGLSEALAA